MLRQNLVLCLLVILCADALWKWTHWETYTAGLEPWMIAMGIVFRLTYLGAILYVYALMRKNRKQGDHGDDGTES